METYVSAQELSKTYKSTKALDSVGFTVCPGEIFGLLGPSGAGKTTLLRVLTGQIPYDGEAMIFGRHCFQLSDSEYQKIGIVLDNVGLYERLTCYENLKLFAKLQGISVTKIGSVLTEVHLQEECNKKVSELSKGMRQRLTLARAIMHQPKTLFLDEPTSGLDPVTIKYIHNIITSMAQNGTAIVLATHNMDEASKLCTKLALLSKGSIIESDSPAYLCIKHSQNKGHEITLKDTSTHLVRTNAEIVEILKKEDIVSIHTLETTLEDVFIKLTGERLM